MNYSSFSRTALLIGEEGLWRLASANVLVAGIGGVGSYAVEALVRAGLGSLTLVDNDTIHPSNINRQLHALTSTVGQTKVTAMAERIMQINPSIKIVAIQKLITPENLPEFEIPRYDLVLDAIDSFSSKLALIKQCVEHHVPVISSMGAAGKLDPSRIRISDIAESHGCRLARKIRKELRRIGINQGIRVVFSDEQSCPECSGRIEEGWDNRRVLGSISFIPAAFGLFMAAEAIRMLLPLRR